MPFEFECYIRSTEPLCSNFSRGKISKIEHWKSQLMNINHFYEVQNESILFVLIKSHHAHDFVKIHPTIHACASNGISWVRIQRFSSEIQCLKSNHIQLRYKIACAFNRNFILRNNLFLSKWRKANRKRPWNSHEIDKTQVDSYYSYFSLRSTLKWSFLAHIPSDFWFCYL